MKKLVILSKSLPSDERFVFISICSLDLLIVFLLIRTSNLLPIKVKQLMYFNVTIKLAVLQLVVINSPQHSLRVHLVWTNMVVIQLNHYPIPIWILLAVVVIYHTHHRVVLFQHSVNYSLLIACFDSIDLDNL